MLFEGNTASEIMPILAKLADANFLREAVWLALSGCQEFEDDWYFDANLANLVVIGARLSIQQSPINYSAVSFFTKLMDEALFASSDGVPLLPPQVVEDLNAARILATQVLSEKRDIDTVSL
jgi:hypothetical protein